MAIEWVPVGLLLRLWRWFSSLFRKLRAKGLIRFAEYQSFQEIKQHTTSVIDLARSDVRLGPHYLAWHKLMVAALSGYARADVIGAHCEAGNPDCPVIFCNFRSYAHAVKEILDRLEHKLGSPYPIVWTLLKRPIFDWYNPFPSRSQVDKLGKLTLDWWEAYKDKNVEIKKKQRDFQVRRLVAHPALPFPYATADLHRRWRAVRWGASRKSAKSPGLRS